MGALWIGVASAVASAFAAFALTFYIRVRDERRQGGAAENRLHSDLLRAHRMLEGLELFPDDGDLEDLQIGAWDAQWDRLATRFDPVVLDEMERTVETLRYVRAYYGRNKATDERIVGQAKDRVEGTIAMLEARRRLWIRKRPWVRDYPRNAPKHVTDEQVEAALRTERRGRRVLATAAALAAVAVIAVTAAAGLAAKAVVDGDPITAATAEAELREMAPEAATINCAGDDGDDRWTCTVASTACAVAGVDPETCSGATGAVERFEVDGDSSTDTIAAFLVGRLLGNGKDVGDDAATVTGGAGTPAGWIGHVGEPDPAAR